ncbi:uncharacterized protein RSE6_06854 [Rhynchosporium secalis]|uniref:Uncharacterized protein n=1 Tax=Rhynchosporium secalis TaxID=38038 RepID=A0A1E1MBK9_RHYSE|nr:uncharacterized protein RSE6_06854 [Rhynchosporium secalis]
MFTPSDREPEDVPAGQQMTELLYSEHVIELKSVLVVPIPGFSAAKVNQKIDVAKYKPADLQTKALGFCLDANLGMLLQTTDRYPERFFHYDLSIKHHAYTRIYHVFTNNV